MKKIIIALFLVCTSYNFAQVKNNVTLAPDLGKIVKLTYELNYDEALNLVDKHISINQDLFWKFIHAIINYRKELFNNLKNRLENEQQEPSQLSFNSSYNEFTNITHLGEEIISQNPNDTTALFYTGASYGYLGLSNALNNENFKAASLGKKGLDYHDKLIQLCPNWADVYLSQGIFNFYASDVPWYIKPILWILGRSGSEEKALNYLSLVINNGKIARFEAYEMLIKLYIRKGETALARKNIDNLIKEVPDAKYYYLFLFALEFKRYDMPDESTQLLKYSIGISKGDELSETAKELLGYIYIRIAMNYKMSNDFKNTIIVLNEFIKRNLIPSKVSLCYLVMGDSYIELGDYKNANDCLNWIIVNGTNKDHIRKANDKLLKIKKN